MKKINFVLCGLLLLLASAVPCFGQGWPRIENDPNILDTLRRLEEIKLMRQQEELLRQQQELLKQQQEMNRREMMRQRQEQMNRPTQREDQGAYQRDQ